MKTIKIVTKTFSTLDITLDDAPAIWEKVKTSPYRWLVACWKDINWDDDSRTDFWLKACANASDGDILNCIADALDYDGWENAGPVITRDGIWHWRPVFYRY